MPQAAPLPDLVTRWLGDFVQAAKTAFGSDLLSALAVIDPSERIVAADSYGHKRDTRKRR